MRAPYLPRQEGPARRNGRALPVPRGRGRPLSPASAWWLSRRGRPRRGRPGRWWGNLGGRLGPLLLGGGEERLGLWGRVARWLRRLGRRCGLRLVVVSRCPAAVVGRGCLGSRAGRWPRGWRGGRRFGLLGLCRLGFHRLGLHRLGFHRRGLRPLRFVRLRLSGDRKSTRLNSSHEWISYAVFCLKKKKKKK